MAPIMTKAMTASEIHTYAAAERRNTLRKLSKGQSGVVVKLHGEGAVRRRIMDMGITKGVTVTVHKVAPLGDPVEISVRGYDLTLRRADASMIELE